MRKGWQRAGAVVISYAALSVTATWPLARHFTTHAVGSAHWGSVELFYETPVNLWNLWWFRHAVIDLRQSPFECQTIFYPFGADLRYHTLAPLHGLVGVVLQSGLSLASTQNLLLLLNLVASGVAAYLLARQLGLRARGSFLAGAIFAFSPGVFAHLYVGHFELLSTFWLPAGLLIFLRLIECERMPWGKAVGLGLVFIGAAYTSFYYVVYLAELVGLAAIVGWKRSARRVVVKAMAVAAVVGCVGTAPVLWAFVGPDAPEPVRPTASDLDRFAGDVTAFFVPSFTHPLLAGPLTGVHDRIHHTWLGAGTRPVRFNPPQETTLFVGFSVLTMALCAIAWRRRLAASTGLAIVVAITFGVLALGAHLRIYGTATSVPLPGGLLPLIPLVGLARAPGRCIVVVMLGMGILAGTGWEQIRLRVVRWGLIALLAMEYAATPLPLFSTHLPEVYDRLAADPRSFAVLEIPFGLRDGLQAVGEPDDTQIFAQTRHRHPIVGGMVSRLSRDRWQALLTSPVIGSLVALPEVASERLETDRSRGPSFFGQWQIKAIIVHPRARGSMQQQYVERVLPIRAREDFADGSQLLWVGNQR